MGNKNSKSNAKRRNKILTYSGVSAAVIGITATAVTFAVMPHQNDAGKGKNAGPSQGTTIYDNLSNDELRTRFFRQQQRNAEKGFRVKNLTAEATVETRTKMGEVDEDVYFKFIAKDNKWVECSKDEAVRSDGVLNEGYTKAGAWAKSTQKITIGGDNKGTVDIKLQGSLKNAVLDFNLPISYNDAPVITMKAQYAEETLGYGFVHKINDQRALDYQWWESVKTNGTVKVTDPDGEVRELTNPSDLANLLTKITNTMCEYGTLHNGLTGELKAIAAKAKKEGAALKEGIGKQPSEDLKREIAQQEAVQAQDDQKELNVDAMIDAIKKMSVEVKDDGAHYKVNLPYGMKGQQALVTVPVELVSDKNFNLKSVIINDGNELDLTPFGVPGAKVKIAFECENEFQATATTAEKVKEGKTQMSKSEDLLLDLYKLTQSPKFKVTMDTNVKHYYNTNNWQAVLGGADAEAKKYEQAKFHVDSLIDYTNRQDIKTIAGQDQILSLNKLPKAVEANMSATAYKDGTDGTPVVEADAVAQQKVNFVLDNKDQSLTSYVNYNDVMKYKMNLSVLKDFLGGEQKKAQKKAAKAISLPEKTDILSKVAKLKDKGVYKTVEWLVNDVFDNVIQGQDGVDTAIEKLVSTGQLPKEFLDVISGKAEENKMTVEFDLSPIGLQGSKFTVEVHKDNDADKKAMKLIDITGELKLGGFEINPEIHFECEDKLATEGTGLGDVTVPGADGYSEVKHVKNIVEQVTTMAKTKQVGVEVNAHAFKMNADNSLDKTNGVEVKTRADVNAADFNMNNFATKIGGTADVYSHVHLENKDELNLGWRFGIYGETNRDEVQVGDQKVWAFDNNSKIQSTMKTLKYDTNQFVAYEDNDQLKVNLGIADAMDIVSLGKLAMGATDKQKGDARLLNMLVVDQTAEAATKAVTDTFISQIVDGNKLNGIISQEYLTKLETTYNDQGKGTTTIGLKTGALGIKGVGDIEFDILTSDKGIDGLKIGTQIDVKDVNEKAGQMLGKQDLELTLNIVDFNGDNVKKLFNESDPHINLNELEDFAKLTVNSLLWGTGDHVEKVGGQYVMLDKDGQPGDWTKHIGTQRHIEIEFPELKLGDDRIYFKEDKPALTIDLALTAANGLQVKTNVHVPFIPGVNNDFDKQDASIGRGIDTQIYYWSKVNNNNQVPGAKEKGEQPKAGEKFDKGTLYLKRCLNYVENPTVDYRMVKTSDFMANAMDWAKYYIANLYVMPTQNSLYEAQVKKFNKAIAAQQEAAEHPDKEGIKDVIIKEALKAAPTIRVEKIIDNNVLFHSTNNDKTVETFGATVNLDNVPLVGEWLQKAKGPDSAVQNKVALVITGQNEEKGQHITDITATGKVNFVVGVDFSANIKLSGAEADPAGTLLTNWTRTVNYIETNCDFTETPYHVEKTLVTDSFFYATKTVKDKEVVDLNKIALVWEYMDASGTRKVCDQEVQYKDNGAVDLTKPTVPGILEKDIHLAPAREGDAIIAKGGYVRKNADNTLKNDKNTTNVYNDTYKRDGKVMKNGVWSKTGKVTKNQGQN